MRRHEVPTHLNVEDRAFWGLSVRQLLELAGGITGAYSVWTGWPDLPVPLRLSGVALVLATAMALALVRPGGRALVEWAFVALHYLAVPKAAVWRRPEPAVSEWLPSRAGWQELAPQLTWGGRGEEQEQ